MDKVSNFFKNNMSIDTTFGCVVILCIVVIIIMVIFHKAPFLTYVKTSIYLLVGSSIVIYLHDSRLKEKCESEKKKNRTEEVLNVATGLGENDILNIFNRV